MSNEKKKKGKLRKIPGLIKQNMVSLHHFVWGKGWKRFLFAVALTLIILVSLLTITLEVTSTPKFCNSCHNMKPYYASWKTSSHKDVTCTDCHFPPGIKSKLKGKFTALSMLVNYFTGVYKRNKPWAEISDLSCMREGCHETRLLVGKVPFKKKINFDHAPHLNNLRRGKKLRCTSCHSQIVQGSHISVTESTCFLCHFKTGDTEDDTTAAPVGNSGAATSAAAHKAAKGTGIDQCTKCHQPPVADPAKPGELIPYDHKMVLERGIVCQKCHGTMVVGDGSVPKMRCSGCHADKEKIKHYNDGPLMHKNHITDHKIECDQCHTLIQHKSVSRSESVKPDCHACHPDFHNAQLYMFSGKTGRGLPNHPSPMFESGLNCQACHIYHQSSEDFEAKGKIVKASAKSCEPCHGTGYNKMLDRWKVQTDRGIAKLSKILDKTQATLQKNKSKPGYESASKKMADATYNYKLVKFGNSIHNIAFANKLMKKSYEFATESLTDIGSSFKLPPFQVEAPITPGDCSNCHKGIERKELKVFGWQYSHANHLKKHGLACSRCHSNEQKHGQLVIAKQDCMTCHHQEDSQGKRAECKTCHYTQDAIYFSHVEFTTFKIPNVMAAEVSCVDCHQDEDENLIRPDKQSCINCHDEDYGPMFKEWQDTSIKLLQQLRDKVKRENLDKDHNSYKTLLMLEKDGSKGIHNPELYEKLIEEALR